MILYFADRQMNIIGHASTTLPGGRVIREDLKSEEVATGVATFSCFIGYTDETRAEVEAMASAGNYLLRSHDNENEFYTIIDSEIDTKNREVYIYAEDAGLDLINEIVGEFEADGSYNAEWYVNKYIADSGFEIGINEIPASDVRKLAWEGEATVTERLASIATQFGGFEVSYSYEIKGLEITKKYINIYEKRGKDEGVQLRLDRDIERIVTSKSVANLATAFLCEGGVPDNAETPITFTSEKYSYDDGDFFIDGNKLKSRKANEKWSRYVWNKEPNKIGEDGGYIVRPYSYNTTNPETLKSHALAELKKVCDVEINYEIDINRLPDGVKIGDRVNIVDDAGELYVSTRVLLLETSVCDKKYKATLGEHIIKKSGISQKVTDLATEFAKTAQSALRTYEIAMDALNDAKEAQEEVGKVGETVTQLQVGGTNLIPKAKMGARLTEITDNSVSRFGYICPGNTKEAYIFGTTDNLDLKVGTKYTVAFTCWLDTTVAGASQKFTWDLGADTLPQKFLEATPTPTRHLWTISSDHADITDAILRFIIYEADNEGYYAKYPIYVTDIKIEEGTKATSWTAAPVDILEAIGAAQNDASTALGNLEKAEDKIKELADSIAMIVRDNNGGSLLKQDSSGLWYFDISDIEENISNTARDLADIEGIVRDANGQIDVLKSTAAALQKRTEYVRSYVDENGKPCIELGEGDSKFKVRITNTDIQFEEDGAVPAKINRKMLIIEKTLVKNELQFGDDSVVSGVWIWKRRNNGNLGLSWIGGSN